MIEQTDEELAADGRRKWYAVRQQNGGFSRVVKLTFSRPHLVRVNGLWHARTIGVEVTGYTVNGAMTFWKMAERDRRPAIGRPKPLPRAALGLLNPMEKSHVPAE